MGWGYATVTTATTTSIVSTIGSTLFTGVMDLFLTILPYAIGMLIFFIGYRFARRALSGR